MPAKLSAMWRKWRWVILAIAIAIAVWLWWPRPTTQALTFRCPEHDIQIAAFDTVISRIPIAPNTGTTPEFHDCQRMRVGNGYGPLIAIWAAERLAQFFPPLKPGDHDGSAYAVAQVLNLGNGPDATSGSADYGPLSIRPGLSCVYLWRSAAPDTFQARIVHQIDQAGLNACDGLHKVDRTLLGAPQLSVHVIRGRDLPASSIPPVTRWDQDPERHVQYIGIRCGDAWCEIGPREGFTSSGAVIAEPGIDGPVKAAYSADEVYPLPGARWQDMRTVKGWYDQQELSVWSAGKLVPSGVIGTIIPNPVLDVIGGATATGPKFNHRWVPSAYVHVTGAYHGKQLQLEQGVSKLYICKGLSGDCPGVTATGSGADWWSKLVAPSGAVTYHPVAFNTHGGGVIPAGAARWRWLETDETLWTRCDEGCCTNR